MPLPSDIAVGDTGTDLVNFCNQLKAEVAAIFTPDYDSGEIAFTNGGSGALAHGLGGEPSFFQVVLKCISAEGGWSVGDHIILAILATTVYSEGSGAQSFSCAANATELKWTVDSDGIRGSEYGTGSTFQFTPANWRLILRAWR